MLLQMGSKPSFECVQDAMRVAFETALAHLHLIMRQQLTMVAIWPHLVKIPAQVTSAHLRVLAVDLGTFAHFDLVPRFCVTTFFSQSGLS